MAACIENVIQRVRESFDDHESRNQMISYLAGTLFAIGWWVMIDTSCRYSHFNNAYHVCGVLGTVSFFMINSVSSSSLEMYQHGLGSYNVLIWFFIGFVLGFGSVITSLWILFGAYVIPGENVVPGLGVFFQNFLIFLGSMLFKFGRKEESY